LGTAPSVEHLIVLATGSALQLPTISSASEINHKGHKVYKRGNPESQGKQIVSDGVEC